MGLEAAIKSYGLSKLARSLGISPQRLNNWRSIGVPESRCPDIEALTGVPREALRSDIDWKKYDRPCPACGSKSHANRKSKALRKRREKDIDGR